MGYLLKKHADENFLRSKHLKALGHHSTIRQAKEYIEAKGFDFNEYFTFTVVRNPWSREYSMFNFLKNNYYKHVANNTLSKLKKKRQELLRYCAIECPDFKSYLLSKSKKVYKFSNPKRFLTINNEIKVKYIAKLENLNESQFFLSEKIQIDLKKLPYRNRRQEQRKELYKIYDEEMIKTSLKLFNWEIKNLGYNFDSCANIKC